MAELDYGHYYREWHNESDEHFERMSGSILGQLAPFLLEDRSFSVLDIGCGMGFAIGAMRKAGFKTVKGVDIDASQVAACKRRGLDVKRVTNLVEYLKGLSESFGVVLMLDVLEHIPVGSQIDVLRAIHAVMAPGGRLILQVPNASSILATRWLYQDFTHASSFTERSIRFALNNASFTKVEVPQIEVDPVRPSLWNGAILSTKYRWQLKRWLVRRAWRIVLEVESCEAIPANIPVSLNLFAIADKDE